MIQILITDISIKEKILCNKPHNITVINSTETETAINQIKRLPRGPIEIYDYTFNPQHNHNERIAILDHINKTGHNPLIGNQDKIRKQFIDISSLYKTKEGVTTRCLGKRFNTKKKDNKYPSTYICHVAIILKALGRENIKAFLINILEDTPDD